MLASPAQQNQVISNQPLLHSRDMQRRWGLADLGLVCIQNSNMLTDQNSILLALTSLLLSHTPFGAAENLAVRSPHAYACRLGAKEVGIKQAFIFGAD